MRWSPNSTVLLLCTAHDPELRTVTNEFPSVEIRVKQGETGSFRLSRLPTDEVYGARAAGAPSLRPFS